MALNELRVFRAKRRWLRTGLFRNSLCVITLAFLATVPGSGEGLAQAQSERQPLVKELLGDRSSDEVLKGIERQERERVQQDAERTARETEVRRMLREIRERLFDIELFLAQRKDGVRVLDCEAASRQAADLQARIDDAEALRTRVMGACGSVAAKGTQSQALCSDQATSLQVDISKLRGQRASLMSECPKR